MSKTWKLRHEPSQEKIESLSQELPNISADSVKLLLKRGIGSYDEAKDFFTPQNGQLHDPFLMLGMDTAVNTLSEAVFSGKRILIYGDYDVDGTTSVSLLYLFLKKIDAVVEYYIPDRYKEGYGLSDIGMDYAIENDVDLLVTVDCGIRAVEQITKVKSHGIETIICDHHEPPNELPPAVAILDPKQKECKYPYKELCGCGVAYKLLQGFCEQNTIDLQFLDEYLDLVTVATCSDIVPITGENRLLVHKGLQKLNANPILGIGALIKKTGYTNQLNVRSVVFGLGPRINAAGRINHAFGAVKLLTSFNHKEAEEFAEQIELHNKERRELDSSITTEALEQIQKSPDLIKRNTTVLSNPNWHKGVIGIVASRLIESYHRPTIVFTEQNGLLTGSARSVGNFNILEAITACDDLLEKYGGHKFAAGLSLKRENFQAFRQAFEKAVSEKITNSDLEDTLTIDLEIESSRITSSFLNLIKRMEPFGPHNMQPVFLTTRLKVDGSVRLLKDEHLKFNIQSPQGSISCIAFGMKEHFDLVSNAEFDLAYSIDENHYQGKTSIQLMVRDIRRSS